MYALPSVVRPCINEAVARGARLVERAVDHAVAALDAEALHCAGGQRRELQMAAREIPGLRGIWCSAFPGALRAALEHPEPPHRAAAGRLPKLDLVADDDLMRTIDGARLAQQVAPLVEGPLQELDALMSAALGLEGIQPERNPLRVELFTATLRQVLGEPAPEQARWPALWMRHMAEPVAHDLLHLYRSAARLLLQAGVQAAAYRVVTAAAPLERASGPAPLAPAAAHARFPAPPDGSGLTVWLGRAMRALRGPLLRDFLGSPGAGQLPVQRSLEPSWYDEIDEELAALEAAQDEPPAPPLVLDDGQRHLPPVERPTRTVGTDSPLSPDAWGPLAAPRQRSLVRTRLKKSARQVGQVMGLEVVRQLVDEVARDPRLLAPVREAIVALEPALARLALHAPRFFGEAGHPARRLVERVAEQSFRFNDEFDPQFQQFLAPVQARFRDLNAQEALQDTAAFTQALEQLEASWTQQERREAGQREQLLQAVQFAERRQAEAEQIAWNLSHRSDLEGAPALVQEFLYSQWALVLAHARLASGSAEPDPGGYLGVVSDLLWSVKRDIALRDPARAFEVIPVVLAKLREGLELLGQTPAEMQSFFGALEQLHRPVLKLRAAHRRHAVPLPAAVDDERLLPAGAQTPQPAAAIYLAPQEQRSCGFEEITSGHAPLEDVPSDAATGLADHEVQSVVAGLCDGSWVDLLSGQHWRRARLVWSGTRGALYMFVSEGGEPHSMTRRSLQRLVAQRLLRPVDTREVVQQAIEALSQAEPQALAA